jgi:hypothetical protein
LICQFLYQPTDFDAFLRHQKEENWTLLSRENSYSISISKEKMTCDGNSFFMIRETGFLPFGQGNWHYFKSILDDILNGYCSEIINLHIGLESIEQIDYLNKKNGGPCSVCKLNYKLPSFKPREFIVSYSVSKPDSLNDVVMLIAKNSSHPKVEKSKTHVRGKMHQSLIIEKKSSNLCKVTQISYVDLGDGISAYMYNNALSKRKIHFLPTLNNVLLKRKTENSKRPLNHYKILDTFDEILMKHK